MLRKNSPLVMALGLMLILAGCAGSTASSPTAPSLPAPTEASGAQAPATSVVTQAAAEVTPGGGLVINGGNPPPEAIAPDNLDRLNSFFQIPLSTFMLAMSFSPDGKLLAVATAGGGVILDVDGQTQVATFAPNIPLSAVAWSPDGKLVAGVPGDPTHGKITLWDVAANRESDLLKDGLAGQTAFDFSPDGTLAASGGASGVVTVWNLATGQARETFNVADAGADASGGQPAVGSVHFTHDGKVLIVDAHGALDETLRWDLAASQPLPKLSPANHIAGPVAIALFAPGDASHIYWWSRGDIIAVDIASDKETARLSTEDFIQSVAFTPDGKLLAAASAGTANGSMSPLVKLWDTTTGQDAKVLTGFTQIPTAMAFSPDGSRLALGVGGEGIAIWGLVQNK